MSLSFEFDISKLAELIEKSPEVAANAARIGLHDALDEWRAESVDIAPIDEATLRRSITVGDITEEGGLNMTGEISANATVQSKSGRFNYAYYIHEHDAGGKNLLTPGTEKKFLEIPGKKNERKWAADIEKEIRDGLDKAGW
ncbi:HK97 gp10 family phage protein [Paenibacillus urinalis]|uniref:HK97 gp10 family phage protein n=1 Tax=Paenibacillus urinalis TaxID=521520 RepID=UPI00195F6CDD